MTELLPLSWVELGVLLSLVGGVVVAVILFRAGTRGRAMEGRVGRHADAAQTGENPFDDRLRRLEALHRDGLLAQGEYRRKRREILDEKW